MCAVLISQISQSIISTDLKKSSRPSSSWQHHEKEVAEGDLNETHRTLACSSASTEVGFVREPVATVMADFESLHAAESEAREDAGGVPPAELPEPEPEPEPKELTEAEIAANEEKAAKKAAKKERKKREPAKELSLEALKKVQLFSFLFLLPLFLPRFYLEKYLDRTQKPYQHVLWTRSVRQLPLRCFAAHGGSTRVLPSIRFRSSTTKTTPKDFGWRTYLLTYLFSFLKILTGVLGWTLFFRALQLGAAQKAKDEAVALIKKAGPSKTKKKEKPVVNNVAGARIKAYTTEAQERAAIAAADAEHEERKLHMAAAPKVIRRYDRAHSHWAGICNCSV